MKATRLMAQGFAAAALAAAILLLPTAQGAPKDDARARLAKAEALFAERCKKSGEFIHRTVENVEAVMLLKIRPANQNFSNQFALDDPYGADLGGDSYIMTFLRGYETRQAQFAPGSPRRLGYPYVEAIDEKDGKRYRYTGSKKVVGQADVNAPNVQRNLKRNPNYDLNNYAFVLDRVPASGPPPRYGVTYDDLSTTEDRDYWIAGSSLRVIDLKTNEVIAERIGYMMDPGQGNTYGGRSPWLLAANNACPHFFRNPNNPPNGRGSSAQMHQTQDFVEAVLKPKGGN